MGVLTKLISFPQSLEKYRINRSGNSIILMTFLCIYFHQLTNLLSSDGNEIVSELIEHGASG